MIDSTRLARSGEPLKRDPKAPAYLFDLDYGMFKIPNPARYKVSKDTQYTGTGEYLYGYLARPCPACGSDHDYSSGYCEICKELAPGYFDDGPEYQLELF